VRFSALFARSGRSLKEGRGEQAGCCGGGSVASCALRTGRSAQRRAPSGRTFRRHFPAKLRAAAFSFFCCGARATLLAHRMWYAVLRCCNAAPGATGGTRPLSAPPLHIHFSVSLALASRWLAVAAWRRARATS